MHDLACSPPLTEGAAQKLRFLFTVKSKGVLRLSSPQPRPLPRACFPPPAIPCPSSPAPAPQIPRASGEADRALAPSSPPRGALGRMGPDCGRLPDRHDSLTSGRRRGKRKSKACREPGEPPASRERSGGISAKGASRKCRAGRGAKGGRRERRQMRGGWWQGGRGGTARPRV